MLINRGFFFKRVRTGGIQLDSPMELIVQKTKQWSELGWVKCFLELNIFIIKWLIVQSGFEININGNKFIKRRIY